MSVNDWVALITVAVGSGGIGAIARALIANHREETKASTVEAAAVRAERVDLLDRLEHRLAVVERRQAWTEGVNAGLWNHIGVLEAQIVEGKGPPPAPRPTFPEPPSWD